MNNNYFLLRHGQTPYQAENRRVNYPDPEIIPIPITDEGVKQIQKAAKALKKEELDIIYASPTFRTTRSAEIVSGETGAKIIYDKRLVDLKFGIYGGMSFADYNKVFPTASEKYFKVPEKGESWQECGERAIEVLEEIEEKYQNKNILIVSHGAPLLLLEGRIRGLSEEEAIDLLEEKNKKMPKTGELRIFKK